MMKDEKRNVQVRFITIERPQNWGNEWVIRVFEDDGHNRTKIEDLLRKFEMRKEDVQRVKIEDPVSKNEVNLAYAVPFRRPVDVGEILREASDLMQKNP